MLDLQQKSYVWSFRNIIENLSWKNNVLRDHLCLKCKESLSRRITNISTTNNVWVVEVGLSKFSIVCAVTNLWCLCHLICTPDEASTLHTEWSPSLWQLSPNRKSSSYKNTTMRYYTLLDKGPITIYTHTEVPLSSLSVFLCSGLQAHLAGVVWWQDLRDPRFPWTSESQRVSSGEIWEEKMVRSFWSDPSFFCVVFLCSMLLFLKMNSKIKVFKRFSNKFFSKFWWKPQHPLWNQETTLN